MRALSLQPTEAGAFVHPNALARDQKAHVKKSSTGRWR
jgi:hypothetical protein